MKKTLFSIGVICLLLQVIFFFGILRYGGTIGIFYWVSTIISFLIWATSILLLIKSLKSGNNRKLYITLLVISIINFLLFFGKGGLWLLIGSVMILISIIGIMNGSEQNEKKPNNNTNLKMYAKYIVPLITTLSTFLLTWIINKLLNTAGLGFIGVLFFVTLAILIITPIIVYLSYNRKTDAEIKNQAGRQATWSLLIAIILLIVEYLILSFLDQLNILEFSKIIGG